ncbi:CHAT domain-containing protein [Tenacibaculum sp. Bg11-29]|uniref:CHAT domain-containing protein n=1 Tax=Tenacibaculum sp. Bg11-29 TaxID=2058306 RepID=UPI000C326C4E|nr:CHAT domain-containing protein [Tenacibaculum sp. Bg11-29]PKH50688.1 CHAT domain-containing protein [Tenacibaculum sp. Bg11-29]
MKWKILLVFFYCVCVKAQNIEKEIYKALDDFSVNKNEKNLQILEEKEEEFVTKLVTQEEQLAFVILQCNKGYYLKENNKLEEAIFTYEKAWKRFSEKKLSNYNIIEYCLKPLGNLYTKTKDYTNAENSIKYYTFLAEKKGDVAQELSGIINLSKMYQTIGSHELVVKLIEIALKNKKISKEQKQKIEAIKITSLIFLNKKGSLSLFKQTAFFTEQSKENKYYTHYKIALKNKDYKEAFRNFYLVKNHSIKKEYSRREKAKILVEEAQLCFLLKNNKKAKESLNKALRVFFPNKKNVIEEMLFAENTFIDVFDLYALLEFDEEKAIDNYLKSFYVANMLEKRLTSQESKIIHQVEKRSRSEKCIELLLNKYKNTLNENYLRRAFLFAESGKSNILKEKESKKRLLKKYRNDSLLLREEKLTKKKEKLTSQLIKEQLTKSRASVIHQFNKQLNNISINLKELHLKIEKKYSLSKNNLIQSLQNKLTKNTMLIEYFYGEQAIYQFVITKASIKVNEIDINIEKQVLDYVRFFNSSSRINNNINKFSTQAFSVYKALKFNEALSYENVYLITDGLLNFIPFETLLIEQTNEEVFSKMPFVVKNQNIVYNSSSEFYLKEEELVEKSKLLGVFPVFLKTNSELKYSIDEAEYVNKIKNSTILMKEEAKKDFFLGKVTQYNMLHFSTHASSGDFVKPACLQFYDKELTLNELYSLNLTTKLVVLSACETGVGKLEKGEGAMSIARGFRYAGAENVLFTLWKINDKATSILMKTFYEYYDKYQSVSYANQQSKIEYLKNENIVNSKKSPYYWGSFVYYGTGSQSEISNNSILYVLTVFFSLIVIYLSFKYIKRQK